MAPSHNSPDWELREQSLARIMLRDRDQRSDLDYIRQVAAERREAEKRQLHCWADGNGSTCLLIKGHEGPHEFTPDENIQLTFGNV